MPLDPEELEYGEILLSSPDITTDIAVYIRDLKHNNTKSHHTLRWLYDRYTKEVEGLVCQDMED